MGNDARLELRPDGARLAAQSLAAALAGAVGLAVLVAGSSLAFGFGWYFRASSFVLYGAIVAIVITRIHRSHDHDRFGPANAVTLGRAVLVCLLGGFTAEAGVALLSAGWIPFGVAALALLLDAADGFIARRQGLTSAFGARFDMEIDALMILVLSIFALAVGKAGPWILASGLMRYAYVAASRIWPRLKGPLPPARRRKLIAALQGCTLAALLTPVVQPPVSALAAAAALALLTYSFAADIVFLARRP